MRMGGPAGRRETKDEGGAADRYMVTSRICFEFGDHETAEKLARAILPEAESTRSRTSSVTIYVNGASLCMEIEAISITVLRALLNSYIRWISTSFSVISLKGD